MIHGRADRHGDSPPKNTGLSPASVGLLKTSNFQVGKLRWDEPYPRKQLLLPSSANTSSERCAVTCAEMCSSAWSSSSEINIEKCQWLCPWTYGQLVREKLLDLDWGDVRSRKPPVWVLNLFSPTEIQLLTDLRGYSEIHREVFSTRAENLPIRAKQSDQVAKSTWKKTKPKQAPQHDKQHHCFGNTHLLRLLQKKIVFL